MMHQQSKVRFGLVGCGRIGAVADENVSRWVDAHLWLPYTHAAAISAAENAALVAVCDRDEIAAQRAASRFCVPAWYTDFRTMLERERLDALAVATRTAERLGIIEHGVAAGIRAIYCEKPLSNTLEDADHLRRLLEGKGVHFVYGTKRRFMPTYRQVKELVAAGEIGDLRNIVVRFGDGALFWNHPHSVDIAGFFADDSVPDYVQADLDLDPYQVRGSVIDADPRLRMGYIKFRSGVVAHILASDSYDVELSGTKGQVCVRSDGRAAHWRQRLAGTQDYGLLLSERIVPASEKTSGTVNGVQALACALLGGKNPDYDIELAVRNQEILFSFVSSHLSGGSRVSFPLERRGLTITGRSGELLA
jgi:predicted dehydrogenase